MKFAITKDHRNFFQKHGWIEFEGLLSDDQLKTANQAIDQALAARLSVTPENYIYYPLKESISRVVTYGARVVLCINLSLIFGLLKLL